MSRQPPRVPLIRSQHLLAIGDLSPTEITALLDLALTYVNVNRQAEKASDILKGQTQVNLFFEASTRTQSSFEIAGKRLGADVMNMAVSTSSISKGETVLDTAMTINAMHPGEVRTEIGMNNDLLYRLYNRWIIRWFLKDPVISGEALYFLAAAPEMAGISGRFFNQTIDEVPARHARDRALGRRVWEVSEALTGLEPLLSWQGDQGSAEPGRG